MAPKAKDGWAPRGVIIKPRLDGWKVQQAEPGDAPDLHIVPGGYSAYIGGRLHNNLDRKPLKALEKLLA